MGLTLSFAAKAVTSLIDVQLTSMSMKDKSSSSRVEARFPFVTRTLSLVGARNVGGGGGSMGRAPSTIISGKASVQYG